jgi:hypothetical protein
LVPFRFVLPMTASIFDKTSGTLLAGSAIPSNERGDSGIFL